MTTIAIHGDECTRCGVCVDACALSIYVQDGPDEAPRVGPTDRCIACGHCAALCPANALHHEAFPRNAVSSIAANMLPDGAQTLELLRSRRSIRLFTDEPVSREMIELALEAARAAPTAHNLQEVQFVVVRDPALLDAVANATAAYFARLAKQLRHPASRILFRLILSRAKRNDLLRMLPDFDFIAQQCAAGRDPILHRAPCLLIAHSPRSIHFPESNAAIAIHNAALAAHALGLGGFMLGYVTAASKRDSTLPKLFGIPGHHEIYAGLALGHPFLKFTNWIQRRPLETTWK